MVAEKAPVLHPMKCCWRCYDQAIAAWFAFGGRIPISDPMGSVSSMYFRETFVPVRDHRSCESCTQTLEFMGFDPCDEEKMSKDSALVERVDADRAKYPFLHLFHHVLGFDAVTEEGDYVDFTDHRIQNWLASVDVCHQTV